MTIDTSTSMIFLIRRVSFILKMQESEKDHIREMNKQLKHKHFCKMTLENLKTLITMCLIYLVMASLGQIMTIPPKQICSPEEECKDYAKAL